MEYKFKQIKLSSAEKLWLNEIFKSNFSLVDVNSLKVKLWDKLPKDFNPKMIDNRMIRDNHLTLVGLWHIDPKNPIFCNASKLIETTRDLIQKNPNIKQIKADEIAHIVGISEREAEIILMLIYELGDFWSSATRSNNIDYGFREVSFRHDDSAYDEFLRFQNLEQKMEQFFVGRDTSTNIKNKKLSKDRSTPTSETFGKERSYNLTWNDIYKEFGIRKPAFGKRINFVTDDYKRGAILRDIEQAYVLFKIGYYKPAVILAGSVIEELLRIYLESKNVKSSSNSFDAFIKTCEDNRLLRGAVRSLLNSVRQFRNLVHLENEKSQKDAISIATAQSAVASIFIISKDF